ncbi:MAG: hypothetical protein R2705_14365 [Ilumatobacteraceae bacterium]
MNLGAALAVWSSAAGRIWTEQTFDGTQGRGYVVAATTWGPSGVVALVHASTDGGWRMLELQGLTRASGPFAVSRSTGSRAGDGGERRRLHRGRTAGAAALATGRTGADYRGRSVDLPQRLTRRQRDRATPESTAGSEAPPKVQTTSAKELKGSRRKARQETDRDQVDEVTELVPAGAQLRRSRT